jgi:A/G-specific adenine glycosylase
MPCADNSSPELAHRQPSAKRRRKPDLLNAASPPKETSTEELDRSAFVRHLTAWYRREQRDLPWRRPANAHDPYRVLVSEVMLQQTTVAAVAPYYERFLQRFPTVHSLAAAEAQEVLEHWAGLGYYARARNLHACACAVVERHHGVFPRELHDVLALPGIGRYTAGAVTSIAFDAPSPIVDANVARVLARIFALEGDLKSTANQQRLWSEAEQLVTACDMASGESACRPSELNPGLMELGALICVPRAPRCTACPVETYCQARRQGRENELPHATPKTQEVALHDVCAFIRRSMDGEEQVLLRQRTAASGGSGNWWHGMWELPRTTVGPDETAATALRRVLRDEVAAELEDSAIGSCLKTMHHGVTHHRITLECYEVDGTATLATANAHWFTWPAIAGLAMPSVMRRLLAWLHDHVVDSPQLALL